MNPEVVSVGSDPGKTPKGPLWLPAGSVRAILAMLAMVITGLLLLLNKPLPEWWVASGSMIWAFYFKRS
jgi:hypothetical protein